MQDKLPLSDLQKGNSSPCSIPTGENSKIGRRNVSVTFLIYFIMYTSLTVNLEDSRDVDSIKRDNMDQGE